MRVRHSERACVQKKAEREAFQNLKSDRDVIELTARAGSARAELQVVSERSAGVEDHSSRVSRDARRHDAFGASRARLPCAAGDPDPAPRAGQSFALCGRSLCCGFFLFHPPTLQANLLPQGAPRFLARVLLFGSAMD